jgi:hypothetical protein
MACGSLGEGRYSLAFVQILSGLPQAAAAVVVSLIAASIPLTAGPCDTSRGG